MATSDKNDILLDDNETLTDLLCFDTIANSVVTVLQTDNPITIGIHGDWGAGKSSILLMVEERLKKDKRTLCISFNGWVFEGFQDAKTVIVEKVISGLEDELTASPKAQKKAQEVLSRINWLKISKLALGMAGNAYGVLNTLGTGEPWVKELSDQNIPREMHGFRKDFQELLRLANIDKLVVLVDDLDRCLPDTAIKTLEAIKLFLFVPQAAFIIAADESMIEYAVQQHFPNLPQTVSAGGYARNYLEKLVQVPFRLPSLGPLETQFYVMLLLVRDKVDDTAFKSLLSVSQDALRQPWKSSAPTRDRIRECLGSIPDELETVISVSIQISHLLVQGTKGNPRQIKRFLNTLKLQIMAATERGFGEEIHLNVLAKLLLAQSFRPDLFQKITSEGTAGGQAITLATLEGSDEAQDDDVAKETRSQYEADKWVLDWVEIKPALADVDLRPYIFVSNEANTAEKVDASLNQFDVLIQKLSSGNYAAVSADAEVAELNNENAEAAFNQLVSDIRDTNKWDAAPSSKQGLNILCKHHAGLRSALIAFLDEIPMAGLGGWVVGGWGVDEWSSADKSTFNKLLQKWTSQNENKALAGVAKVSLNTKQGET